VFSAASIPAQGFQSATQSVVGQNLGAGNADRAARTPRVGVALVGGLLGTIGVLQWAYAGPLTTLLAPDLGTAASARAVEFLRLLALSYPAFGAMYVIQGGFNGASRGGVSFRSSLVQYWALQIPLAAVAAVVLDASVTGVFAAIAASHVLTALGLAVYYHRQRGTMFRDAAASGGEAATD
jgi:Na+-driven multidrug efflux pump